MTIPSDFAEKAFGIIYNLDEFRHLQSRGAGGTSDGMSTDLMDAKIGQAKAEVDTEFANLRRELDKLPGTWTVVTTVIGSAVTLFLAIIAVLAFGGDRFDGGIGLASLQRDQLERDAKQDEAIAGLQQATAQTNDKLDILLARTEAE